MKGEWCPYREALFCQEEADCPHCNVYYQTMPIPEDGRTVEEIERANSRLFSARARKTLDKQVQIV